MMHKFATGQDVYYSPAYGNMAARGKYRIVRTLPIEADNRLAYRIKSIAETFERTAEEHQLSRSE
jgi:adenylate cyclase class IV